MISYCQKLNGIAMNHMTSHGLLTSNTLVLNQVKLCVICCGYVGNATYVSSSTFNYPFYYSSNNS
jgi:hypothetical protein